MADEKKKISELDEYSGSVAGLCTIGTKENAAGNPLSYKVPLTFLQDAADKASAKANEAGAAAEKALSIANTTDTEIKAKEKERESSFATMQSDVKTAISDANAAATEVRATFTLLSDEEYSKLTEKDPTKLYLVYETEEG